MMKSLQSVTANKVIFHSLIGLFFTLPMSAEVSAWDCYKLEGAKIIAEDGTYLGTLDDSYKSDSIYNEYTGETNDEFLDSKWDEITGDLIPTEFQGHELEENQEVYYTNDNWVRNPDWMKKKKITVEIPNSIDIILDEIKLLLKAAVANVDYEIEGTDKLLQVEENNPIWEILEDAMHFGYLEDKLTRGQVINFALLHFYRTLKSDENINLPNGYESIQDEITSHS